MRRIIILILTLSATIFWRSEAIVHDYRCESLNTEETEIEAVDILPLYGAHNVADMLATASIDTTHIDLARAIHGKHQPTSIYALPYSLTLNVPDWRRLWINTAVLASAFSGTLIVLELLPENATNWSRAEIKSVPPFKRWYNHVIKEGPEWDGDKFIFNYVLHPYAGTVYFMGARGNGFNYFRSLLYAACISTIGWEYGIEGFMERPSIQDFFITPIVGSIIGELFYKLKRNIVYNDYSLFGSKIIGNIVALLIDPLNEVVGLFDGNPARHTAAQLSLMPQVTAGQFGFSLVATL